MTYMTSLYMIFSAPYFHDKHNKFIRWRPIPTYVLYHYWAIHAHTYPPTHVPHILQFTLLPSSSHLIRETPSPANQTCTHNIHTVTGSYHNAPYMAHTAPAAHNILGTPYLHDPILLSIPHICSSPPPYLTQLCSLHSLCLSQTSYSRLLKH